MKLKESEAVSMGPGVVAVELALDPVTFGAAFRDSSRSRWK